MPHFRTPLPLRKLKAMMALKDLSLADVSKLTGLHYTTCSAVLAGNIQSPARLGKIKAAILKANMPEEVAA